MKVKKRKWRLISYEEKERGEVPKEDIQKRFAARATKGRGAVLLKSEKKEWGGGAEKEKAARERRKIRLEEKGRASAQKDRIGRVRAIQLSSRNGRKYTGAKSEEA